MNSGYQSAIELDLIKSARRVKASLISALILAGVGLPGANTIAQPPARSQTQAVTVNCPERSIQSVLNLNRRRSPLILNINGICTEDVSVTQDDVTFNGLPGGTVSGTITVDGARRVVFQNLTLTGTSNGVEVIRNGAATVRDSIISNNDDNGIFVENGAHVAVLDNEITQNGQNASDPDFGVGIWVDDGSNVRIVGNTITDNLSYGIEVLNGSTARVESNSIMRNGRPSLFESGVGVFRARVRANGNVFQNNAFAAIEASNDAGYRTGAFLSPNGKLDDPFGFETINAGTGQIAIFLSRGSYVDLRQVIVQGAIDIGTDSLLIVRGDHVGPSTKCSEVDDVTATTVNSSIEISLFTRVNGVITADPNQGNRALIGTPCPLP